MTYLYQTPIKMPRGSHFGSDYWISYSYKLKRKVYLFSMLEYLNFIELEMNSKVEFFCEQPQKIEDFYDGEKQSSVFDFWVYYKNGTSEFHEIKYSKALTATDKLSLRSQKQIALQKYWCEKNNFNHKVITEKELLKSSYRSNNLQILQKHLLRSNPVTSNAKLKIADIISSSWLTMGTLTKVTTYTLEDILNIIAHMYYEGSIEIYLDDRPLDYNTEVTLCETRNIIY